MDLLTLTKALRIHIKRRFRWCCPTPGPSSSSLGHKTHTHFSKKLEMFDTKHTHPPNRKYDLDQQKIRKCCVPLNKSFLKIAKGQQPPGIYDKNLGQMMGVSTTVSLNCWSLDVHQGTILCGTSSFSTKTSNSVRLTNSWKGFLMMGVQRNDPWSKLI